ncbi:hypothetical protein C2S53_002738 [Perilla frutescens var. hirtella]|uniref:Uncharacterized protein n=1 Tax=Perilla frutescens var. hirtella TaxID=608512 RepID=A0AAD4P1Q2_PERFH|nr:hypothetical protein C2S53_002738 [Perilla frutescens var. hirtella]
MPSEHQLNPQFLVDALYCEEHHWENDSLTEGEGDSSVDNNNNDNNNNNNHPFLDLLEQDLWDDDDELTSLLHKEQEIEPHDPSLANARAEAVAWMLNVVHYYSFSALTAVLAVNYLDRFLHSFESHGEKKPWMTQLAAVACISLAAKVEETHVPLLLDFQVEDSKYVFESKTIQRMEILVLSTLQWKMNPVTPLSFLDCIAKKMGFFSREFLRRCHGLLLSLVSDCRFMRYLPSALATATMLYVISSVEPIIGVQHQDQLRGILGINKDSVENCCRLIQEVATTADFYYSCNKRKSPRSPKGVVDACFSSDDSYAPPTSAVASVSSSPEPLPKRVKSK